MNPPRKSKASRRNRKEALRRAHAVDLPDNMDLFPRRSRELTLESARALTAQLGYVPVNLVRIGAFAADNADEPLVAVLYPLLSNNLGGRYDASNARGMPGWRRSADRTPRVKHATAGLLEADSEDDDAASAGANGGEPDETSLQVAAAETTPQASAGRNDKPFPTILWMTQPALHSRICRLEDHGWIARLDQRLKASPEDLAAMEQAHRAYARTRWALLSSEDVAFLEAKGWENTVRDTGVAGIHDFDSVKCLHGHSSHHLCFPEHGNVVGRWVDELLNQQLGDS